MKESTDGRVICKVETIRPATTATCQELIHYRLLLSRRWYRLCIFLVAAGGGGCERDRSTIAIFTAAFIAVLHK